MTLHSQIAELQKSQLIESTKKIDLTEKNGDPVNSLSQSSIDNIANNLVLGKIDRRIIKEDALLQTMVDRSQQKDPQRGGAMIWDHGFDFKADEESHVHDLLEDSNEILSHLKSQDPEAWSKIQAFEQEELKIGRISPISRIVTADKVASPRKVLRTIVENNQMKTAEGWLAANPHLKSLLKLTHIIESINGITTNKTLRNGSSAKSYGENINILLRLKARVRKSYLNSLDNLEP